MVTATDFPWRPSAFDDTLATADLSPALGTEGGRLSRVVLGTPGNDRIHLSGIVPVAAGAGQDVVIFNGDDRPTEGIHLNFGKMGITFVSVEAFVGSDLADTFIGTAASENFSGSDGNDRLFGRAGADRVQGNAGADLLSGGSGNDSLTGGSGRDRLTGGTGHDVLAGGSGIDSLSGGAGNDRLAGGLDADRLSGGSGADHFVFGSLADSTPDAADRIADFSRGEDSIDLSALDADTGQAGDQGFTFIGSAAYSGTAGELRSVVSATGRTVISGDVDGDSRTDVRVVLDSARTLGASDFLL